MVDVPIEMSEVFCECLSCRTSGGGRTHPVTFETIPGCFINRRAAKRHRDEEATRLDQEETSKAKEVEKIVFEEILKRPRPGPSLGVQLRDLPEYQSNLSDDGSVTPPEIIPDTVCVL